MKPSDKTETKANTTKFAVVQDFYLDSQLYEVGDTAELTDHQAKRLVGYVQPAAKAAGTSTAANPSA
jgi:hypothetical protein